jgi:hypothetical protein
VGTASATSLDRAWEERADALAVESFAATRDAAERWTATVTAVVGLSSILGLVKGPGDVAALDVPWKVLTAVVLGLALAAAVAATVLGALAAQGTPRKLRLLTGDAVRRSHRQALSHAARDLLLSRGLAVIAVALLGLGAGIT